MVRKRTIVLFVAISTGCASVPMPSNVTTTSIESNNYIDTVDFSYQSSQTKTFSKLKLCIAENVSNGAVSLQDSSGSFVGPATGRYYQIDHSQVIHGGGAFKYLDDTIFTLIAQGTVDGGPVAFGITKDFVKFDLKAAIDGRAVTLKFLNITRAQQSTGAIVNDGFNPVGTWSGARPIQVYDTLEGVANKVKACLR